jgi:ATP-dependent DNA ligase
MARGRRASAEPPERPADLDLRIPFPPMEAQLVRDLPEGAGWQFEPKWDGFRGLLENASGELRLWSRNARPLLRYFPELRPLGDLLPPLSALDGEIVIERGGILDFDAMQTRLHPAESRVRKLAGEIPARFVAFDILLWQGEELWPLTLAERRRELEQRAAAFTRSPATTDREAALRWLERFESAGLDGVVGKRVDSPYLAGSRDAVVKVKPEKSADCVVVGLRWRSKPGQIATLLLGIYGDDGELDYVGSAAVAAGKHDDIAGRVLPLLEDAPERRFSEPNRWGGGELEEAPVRPELVCEVRYDKVQGHRFRHGTRFLHWREDKSPRQCTWDSVLPRPRKGDPTVDTLLDS